MRGHVYVYEDVMCVWRVSIYMSEYMWSSTCVNVHMYWVDVCVCMYDSVFLRVIGESEFV